MKKKEKKVIEKIEPFKLIQMDHDKLLEITDEINVDLFGNLIKTQPNVIFSSYNILEAIVMLYVGTDKKDNFDIIFKQPIDTLINYYYNLNYILRQSNCCKIANSLWIDKKVNLYDNFVMKARALCDINKIDFSHIQESVNDWVTDKTAKNITNVGVNGVTNVTIVNTCYFNAKWMNKFNPILTQSENFMIDSENKKQVKIMYQKNELYYYEDVQKDGSGLQVLRLDYEGPFMMILLLNKDYEDIIKQSELIELVNKMYKTTVNVKMPKFTAESSFDLTNIFTKIGLNNGTNQYNKMGKNTELQSIIHKCKIDVDEVGTAAAAIIDVDKTAENTKMGNREVWFYANRPFLYYIIYKPIMLTIFAGFYN